MEIEAPRATSAAAEEPNISITSREELIYLLTEAAEIEHGLMCCYLYAAYSLRRRDAALAPNEQDAVERWRSVIVDVARDEMVHLALVSNLLSSVGSAPHFARPNMPVSPGYHPAGVIVSLNPFDRATLDHFIYLERPEGVDLPDGAGFAPYAYRRGNPGQGRLVPTAQDYATVGHLCRGIRAGLASLVNELGEGKVFVGDERMQVGPELLPMAGLTKVRSLREAEAAIDTIVLQGEGSTRRDGDDSHYAHFLGIKREYEALLAANQAFLPARSVARNPVMRRPPEPEGKTWISAEPAATLLDLSNAAYALMLRSLSALFSPVALDEDVRLALSDLTQLSMRVLGPLGEQLTTLAASEDASGVTSGLTFTMSRTLHAPPDARALRVVAEAARAVARGLGAQLPESSLAAARALDALGEKVEKLSRRATTAAVVPAAAMGAVATVTAAPQAVARPAPTAFGAKGGAVEVARGKALTILFEAKRCIHSRHCVLDAPNVFLANTPGEWIFPDAATVETLVGVAHACPSGAIRYERNDGGAAEPMPPVNVARVRENGPLAINASIELAGHGSMSRATFCRCGASKNKPFCDGSHVAAGFAATGEPVTGTTDPLAHRDGPLLVTPRKNGPLAVRGSLEICAGTGRVVSRLVSGAFCRCGGSKNKPFCDGTHAKIGFEADGA